MYGGREVLFLSFVLRPTPTLLLLAMGVGASVSLCFSFIACLLRQTDTVAGALAAYRLQVWLCIVLYSSLSF